MNRANTGRKGESSVVFWQPIVTRSKCQCIWIFKEENNGGANTILQKKGGIVKIELVEQGIKQDVSICIDFWQRITFISEEQREGGK